MKVIFFQIMIILHNNMNKIVDFLSGMRVLEETESPINGKITVVKSLAFGTYIQVGGLTQSGGILYDVWKKPLELVHRTKNIEHRVLILGLGGGTVVKLVKKFWPEARITGVDLDSKMVEMGKKYLGLDGSEIEIVIVDAHKYVEKQSKFKSKFKKYDLILIDLYVGFSYPEKFEQDNFLKLILKLLSNDGIAIFNRLYYGDKRSVAVKFGNRLEKVFSKVEVVYPEANIMFICHK